jgi:hypothetical protein
MDAWPWFDRSRNLSGDNSSRKQPCTRSCAAEAIPLAPPRTRTE